jgi:predicted MFS family arabinose efflux permease
MFSIMMVAPIKHKSRLPFFALLVANSVSVATLYINHALLRSISASFPSSRLLPLLPAAVLSGYTIGVVTIAFYPKILKIIGLKRHICILISALSLAGLATNVLTLILASFFIGCGASVAQRLLVRAARLKGPAAAGTAIGRVICGALVAVLCVKLIGDDLAQTFGWQTVFLIAAGVTSTAGAILVMSGAAYDVAAATLSYSASTLWWSYLSLRRAAGQQAALFAAFNASWTLFLMEVPSKERTWIIVGGCGAGVASALVSGWSSDRPLQRCLATTGSIIIFLSSCTILPFAFGAASEIHRMLAFLVGMALIEAGLQAAIVENQTKVQALNLRAQSSLAAILTACGFLGGSIGAGMGLYLFHTFGWQAAVGFISAAGSVGLYCSLVTAPGSTTQDYVEPHL